MTDPITLAIILAAAPYLRAGDPDAAAAAVEAALPADIGGPDGCAMWAVGYGAPPTWGRINYPAMGAHDEAHPGLALADFNGAYDVSQGYALDEARAAKERAGANTLAPAWRSAATRTTVAKCLVADIATHSLPWA